MSVLEHVGSESKQQLIELLKREGLLTVSELMDATGLARTTLRDHLSRLEHQGLVTSSRRREGPGRPALQYELTSAGHSLFPDQSGPLLRELISFLQDRDDVETIEAFFQSVWEKMTDTARERIQSSDAESLTASLEQIKSLLEEKGFMPEIREAVDEEGTCTVEACNCPFPAAVRKTSLPCQLEIGFYEEVLDAEVERVSYIPDGDPACTYRIRVGSADS